MKKYEFDVCVIGLGPAGMAVSAMAAEAGLKVLGIEQHKIGGECMNVGCIPSKALLKFAKKYWLKNNSNEIQTEVSPFEDIQKDLDYIGSQKTLKMLEKVNLLLNQGSASFIDTHTVKIKDKQYTSKYIFICTGTKPMVPPIKGIDNVEYLTNENIFFLDKIPQSMTILGGGAIGTEMAQAFSRLGCKVHIVHMDEHLIPGVDADAGLVIEEVFKKEGIQVFNSRKIIEAKHVDGKIQVTTDKQEIIVSEKLLIAAGRSFSFNGLGLEKIGIETTKFGLKVNQYLQTKHKNIFAIGDINGWRMLSHAAMHQGMLAFMNTLIPCPFRFKYKNFVVPWTVFSDPQVSQVGQTEKELQSKKITYEVVSCSYADYGAAIAEKVDIGFVRALISPFGKVYGVTIVGEGSGEMINEWALVVQKKIRIHDLMLLQHSFPTMGFLSKRVAETWAMKKMKINWIRKLTMFLFKLKAMIN